MLASRDIEVGLCRPHSITDFLRVLQEQLSSRRVPSSPSLLLAFVTDLITRIDDSVPWRLFRLLLYRLLALHCRIHEPQKTSESSPEEYHGSPKIEELSVEFPQNSQTFFNMANSRCCVSATFFAKQAAPHLLRYIYSGAAQRYFSS